MNLPASPDASFSARMIATYDAPIGQVWEHWTDPTGLAAWFPEPGQTLLDIDLAELRPEPGNEFSVSIAANGRRPEITVNGNVLLLNPPTTLRLAAIIDFASYSDVDARPDSLSFGVQVRGSDQFFLELHLSDLGPQTREELVLTAPRRPFNHQFIASWWARRKTRFAGGLTRNAP
jgi:uncharacterized protein YndB with AHSA1/START domain